MLVHNEFYRVEWIYWRVIDGITESQKIAVSLKSNDKQKKYKYYWTGLLLKQKNIITVLNT